MLGVSLKWNNFDNLPFKFVWWEGYPLWNIFYVDAGIEIRDEDWLNVKSVDDLNAVKIYPIHEMIFACHQMGHEWRYINQICLDPFETIFIYSINSFIVNDWSTKIMISVEIKFQTHEYK